MMCGQLFIKEDLMLAYDIEQIQTLFRPSDSLLITSDPQLKTLTSAQWGWIQATSQHLFLFARLENITHSRLFSNAYFNHRCIILASGYYEWDASRIKQKIVNKTQEPLYIAGVLDETHKHVAIITHEAQKNIAWVHHRQPMVLNAQEAKEYLFKPIKNLDFLRNQDLVVETMMTQVSLFESV